jgi:hypothetical protein
VINEAHVRQWALARIEDAVSQQSLQLRTAWGTPCVEWGSGGWPLYLRGGSGEGLGVHSFDSRPYAEVWTNGLPYIAWSQPFSHEVIEMLVDPIAEVDYTEDGVSSQLEVADPVDERAYRLDGVWVSDFVLPSWFAGATLGACNGQWCEPESIGEASLPDPADVVIGGPLLAPANAPGPYDEMGVLAGAWRTDGSPAG